MYAFWLSHGRPTDKENLVKMNKKYHTFLGTLPLRNSKDPDPYKSWLRIRIIVKNGIRIKTVWIRNTGWMSLAASLPYITNIYCTSCLFCWSPTVWLHRLTRESNTVQPCLDSGFAIFCALTRVTLWIFCSLRHFEIGAFRAGFCNPHGSYLMALMVFSV